MKTTLFVSLKELEEAVETGYIPKRTYKSYKEGKYQVPTLVWGNDTFPSHQSNRDNILITERNYFDLLKDSVRWEDIREKYVLPEIKPCPFCGNKNVDIFYANDIAEMFHAEHYDCGRDELYIVCNANEGGCGTVSGAYYDKVSLIKGWNKRCDN